MFYVNIIKREINFGSSIVLVLVLEQKCYKKCLVFKGKELGREWEK